jgi:hypothetical protein
MTMSNSQLPVWTREQAVNRVLSRFGLPLALRIKEPDDARLYSHMDTSRVKLVVNPWRCGDRPIEEDRLISHNSLVMLYIELHAFGVVEVFDVQGRPITDIRMHEHDERCSINSLARQCVEAPLGATHFLLRTLY